MSDRLYDPKRYEAEQAELLKAWLAKGVKLDDQGRAVFLDKATADAFARSMYATVLWPKSELAKA